MLPQPMMPSRIRSLGGVVLLPPSTLGGIWVGMAHAAAAVAFRNARRDDRGGAAGG